MRIYAIQTSFKGVCYTIKNYVSADDFNFSIFDEEGIEVKDKKLIDNILNTEMEGVA